MNNEAGPVPQQPVCPCCKRKFTCGLQAGHGDCWCADLPPLPPPAPDKKNCYCPDCLRALAASQPP
jgi:hypothetical protein